MQAWSRVIVRDIWEILFGDEEGRLGNARTNITSKQLEFSAPSSGSRKATRNASLGRLYFWSQTCVAATFWNIQLPELFEKRNAVS